MSKHEPTQQISTCMPAIVMRSFGFTTRILSSRSRHSAVTLGVLGYEYWPAQQRAPHALQCVCAQDSAIFAHINALWQMAKCREDIVQAATCRRND